MNHVPDTELFSAYLDGELTADEQVRVERILATSPEARQLLEELRALDNTLQSLPQEKLDEDLSTRVLEIAERRMLLPNDATSKPSAGRAAGAMQGPEEDSIGWLGVPWREISWRGMFSKRALVWSAVILVTAIIIGYTSPSPPKPNQNLAKRDMPSAAAAPAASGENLTTSSTSERRWDVPAGQPRMLRADDMLAKRDTLAGSERPKLAGSKDQSTSADADSVRRDDKDRDESGVVKGQLAMREGAEYRSHSASERLGEKKSDGERAAGQAAKEALANAESGKAGAVHSQEKALRLEVNKAAPMDAVAGTKPAAAPVPAKPAAPLPSRPEPALADVANPGAGPSAPPVAMPKAAAPPKAPVASNTPAANKAFGGLGQGLGGAKHGPGKTDSEGVDLGDNRVAKGSGSLPPLMNGTDFAATDNSPSAGGAAAVNGKRGQARSNRFAGSKAAVAIHVRLDVSALAVQNKVFENLLADNGLGNDQNSKNYARRALKSDGYLQSRITTAGPLRESPAKDSSGHGNGQGDRVGGLPQQVPDNTLQESIGTSSQQDAQFALATSSKPMIYEFDASPEQLAIVIGQIRKRSESFSAPAFTENYGNGVINYGGGAGGGRLADRVEEQQQAKTDVKAEAAGASLSRKEAAQPQAAPAAAPSSASQSTSPAAVRQAFQPDPSLGLASQTSSPVAGAAKQHVVFILNVVDHLPAANRASQVPAATSTPAKQ